MFYSETLLSKTGPLARVWLSANIESKLKRTHILQSNIESSVNAIVDQGQAPLALRLSGQLLLGVVRIYSRKARYLLDDCNETLHKIKMTFRSGNVDLPANQSNTANAASLTLPDVLTELDLLAPLPDPSLLLSQPFDDVLESQESNLLDFGNSQRTPTTTRRTRMISEEPLQLDDDLDLNLDLGNDAYTSIATEREVEVGRDAPSRMSLAHNMDDTFKLDDGDDLVLDLGFDLGADTGAVRRESTVLPDIPDTDLGRDFAMAGPEDDGGFTMPNDIEARSAPLRRRERESLSPLSDIDADQEQELERTYQQMHESTVVDAADEESVHHAQRAKRRKVLQLDVETELRAAEIRAQQNDRSKILKPTSYIPRDPLLLALMNMQKNGDFVSNILGDGRSRGWAPELRGILSLEIITKPLKRKRDVNASSAAQAEAGAASSPARPQIRIPSEADIDGLGGVDGFEPDAATTFNEPANDDVAAVAGSSPHLAPRDPSEPQLDGEMAYEDDAGMINVDDEDSGVAAPPATAPLSLGTKHAVHLLRDRFGPSSASETPSRRAKAGVLFQDLLPERTTTRADATKMFFEVLVLATKDAIKVEQDQDKGAVGAPLRMRAKRGLWGAWAESSAGGEIEEEAAEAEGVAKSTAAAAIEAAA